MTAFQQLPSSVLQTGAIFLSIIIEALPFVLIGSIVSGLIEVYIHLTRFIIFSLEIVGGEFFLVPSSVFFSPLLWMWNCPHYQSFSEKEGSQLHGCSLSSDSTCYQSHCSLCDLFCLWQLLPCRFVTSSRFHSCSCDTWEFSGIFLGFFWDFWNEPIQKENRLACHEHDFSHLSPAKKIFQVFVQAIDEFFWYGALFGCLVASLIQVYVPTRILTSISATPLFAILP